jgi:MFS transporter, UMF1 family
MTTDHQTIDEQTYKKRIRAWTLYDWANSAFVTTVLAAMLPVYYSGVAGASLPSDATATAYWSLSLSFALLVSAVLAPILGTVSDVMRGKKKFLSIFIGVGVVATGLMVFVGTGDWVLASMLIIVGRIAFAGADVFYNALLPHVAKPEDQDVVSTRGYAMGYLGGGLMLAINVAMMLMIKDDGLFEYAGVRLSFLSVAVWWALFSIPILRNIPEPPSASAVLQKGETIIGVSVKRLRNTFKEIRQYGELFKYLVAYLIYNDAIGTIIGVAAIYGAELGFGMLELILALLLVQFAGIPFSLIFGQLPAKSGHPRRHFFLAFILFNVAVLPLVAIVGRLALATDLTGDKPLPYETIGEVVGEGEYAITDDALLTMGEWEQVLVPGEDMTGSGILGSITTLFSGTPDDATYAVSAEVGAQIDFTFNGQEVILTYDTGPDRGIYDVLLDGEILMDADDEEEPAVVDMYSKTPRYNVQGQITLDDPGQYTLSLVNSGRADENSTGTVTALAQIEVLKPIRESNLGLIVGVLFGLQALGVLFALAFGKHFHKLADSLDTRRSILLALAVYCMIAAWGFFLDSTIEYWFLAFCVAIVQGGSQALSRSLYASLSPTAKSGEFFGLYSIMGKMAAITGPLIFAIVATTFDNSRPAVLSLVVLFVVGGYLLTRVDIEAGQRHAQEEDARILGAMEG